VSGLLFDIVFVGHREDVDHCALINLLRHFILPFAYQFCQIDVLKQAIFDRELLSLLVRGVNLRRHHIIGD
jgi:hypothetical protein